MLDYNIIMCKDGKMRVFNEGVEVAVTAELFAQEMNLTSDEFFISSLRLNTTLEEGSTIASFLRCLAPYANMAKCLTDRDIPAYLSELKKLAIATNTFESINIRRSVTISRDRIHEPIPDDVDFIEWLTSGLNSDKPPVWDNRWTMDRQVSVVGQDGEDNLDGYSLMVDFHSIKNVPLVLDRREVFCEVGRNPDPVFVRTPQCISFLNHHKNTVGVYLSNSNWTLQELIEAVVCDGLWFNSPSSADKTRTRVAEAIASIDINNPENEEESTDEASDAEPGTMRVEVADGAFSPMLESLARHSDEWEMIVAAAARRKDDVMVGSHTESLPVSNRLWNDLIVEPTET